jgi:hypothetical protein
MASYIFDKLLTQGVRAGQVPARTQDARAWYRDTAKNVKRVNQKSMIKSDAERMTQRILPGNMYMFSYNPKTKIQLPYYDRFPLVFPFDSFSGGFLGMNLHYLPPTLRAKLMDELYDLVSNERYDETTKLRISYGLLNSARKYRYFKPCVKQYLFSHVQSSFMYIYPSEWDMALFLPTERFSKAGKDKVWIDSRKIARA